MATIMDEYRIIDALFDAALAGDADAIAKLRVQVNRQNRYCGDTILLREIRERNIERVIFILREFGNASLLVKTDFLGMTALHLAADLGDAQVVEVLLDAARRHLSTTSFQAFLRKRDYRSFMKTALHVAVEKGNVDMAKLLVEADPTDRHGRNNVSKSPMYIAVESGFNEIVDIISKTCTFPSLDGPNGRFALRITNHDQVKSSGGTLYKIMDRDALYAAAVAGDADAIAKLEEEADILDEDGNTILHIECGNGNTERVRFILKQFANKNLLTKLNKYKNTALHSAIYSGHTEMVEVLIEAARRDLLVPSFQDFLRQGDKDMDTALHAAVTERNIAIVKLLVEADPTDRHIQNDRGKTPMYIAVEKGYNDIVEIISTTCTAPSLDGPHGSTAMPIKILDQVSRGGSLSGRNPRPLGGKGQGRRKRRFPLATGPGVTLYKIMGKDALYAAAIAGDEDAIAKLELEADKLNKDDETILHVESRNGNTENVRFILREFANNNLLVKLNKDEDTALHLAAYHGHTEVVKVLIDAAKQHLPSSSSANDNTHENPITSFQSFLGLIDKDRNTALHMAVMQGNLATAKLLVMADPSHQYHSNYQHKTPIYIAAERGYAEIAKMICTYCTSSTFHEFCYKNLLLPQRSNALHAAIKNLDEGKKEVRDVFKTIVNVHKCRLISQWKNADDYEIHTHFQRVFSETDEYEQTILELAVERNCLEVVELILDLQYPAYRNDWIGDDFINLMPLIYKATDKEYKNIADLLHERYEVGAQLSTHLKNQASLISAIRRRKKETVFSLLDDHHAEPLVSFVDKLGWTALHHAAYHEFDPIITTIVEAQKKIGHQFVYGYMLPTPFHIAAEKGHTSTVILLMQLWPSWSLAYMNVDRNGQNILHLAALQSNKKMIQGILKHIPEEYKEEFVNEQDDNGNTPLHLLITSGCFVPELIRYEGLDMRLENKDKWTPPDMLYINDQITDGQVQIKFALDHIQINQKRDLVFSSLLSKKRQRKDVIFEDRAEPMIRAKLDELMKEEDTHAIAKCFMSAIAGDAISKAALEMKADTLNKAGETILHVESKKGNTENVRFILSVFAKKSLLSKLDGLKQTALHLAAHHGHTQVVEVLIDAAARHWPSSSSSANAFIRQATGPMGNTALHLAVLNGNVAIVRLIVDADPTDRHVQNNEGKTPIYIAAEKGDKEVIKEICMTCTALSLDGPALPPGGRTTALHAFLQNMGQVTTDGASDVIRMIVAAAKRSSAVDASLVNFEALFTKKDVSGSTVLQLAVEKNFVDAVRLILQEDPAYQPDREIKRNDLMLLIFKAIDNECNNIVELLSQAYQVGIDSDPDHKDVLALILAIQKHDKDCVLGLLRDAPRLVTFTDDCGWTPLHYATYHEFDSILDAIIKAQRDVGFLFEYPTTVSTPFHVSVKYGYTSTMLRLMELWPTSSSDYSPYTVVNENGQNILHLAALAAADNRKEMVQGILKYCPKMYKDQILKQQDNINGDTPLHLLFANGCFIPGLLKHEGLNAMAKKQERIYSSGHAIC